jgi:hypothetical protein
LFLDTNESEERHAYFTETRTKRNPYEPDTYENEHSGADRTMKPFHLRPPELGERDVVRACIDLCALRGYRAERNHCGRFRTLDGKRVITGAEKGTPDWITNHGRFPGFYLEVKRPGGDLSPAQVHMIRVIREGWRIAVAVVDSAEELARWIDAHERKHQEQRAT